MWVILLLQCTVYSDISIAEWTSEVLIEELGAEKRMVEEALTAWVDRGMIGLDEGRGVWVLYEREEDKPKTKPKSSERADLGLLDRLLTYIR